MESPLGINDKCMIRWTNAQQNRQNVQLELRSPCDNIEIRTHKQLSSTRYHVILYAFMQPKNVTAMKNRNCTYEKCN